MSKRPSFMQRFGKTFSGFFIASMKSTLNSEYFLKKDQSHSLSITEIIDLVANKAIFHATLRQSSAPQHCSDLQTTFILRFH